MGWVNDNSGWTPSPATGLGIIFAGDTGSSSIPDGGIVLIHGGLNTSTQSSGGIVTINSTGSGSSSSYCLPEIPTGNVDDSNKTFYSSTKYTVGSLLVYLNGVLQTLTEDYVETDPNTNRFDFVDAPSALLGYTDEIEILYIPTL